MDITKYDNYIKLYNNKFNVYNEMVYEWNIFWNWNIIVYDFG